MTYLENQNELTLYRARAVVTLDRAQPETEAILVRDGRVLFTGSFAEAEALARGSNVRVDTTFEEQVIVPGFIEAHGHLIFNGVVHQYLWLGFDDRLRADGSSEPGCRSVDDVLDRLRGALAHSTSPDGAVFGFGFDPVFLDGASLTRRELDRVSVDVPVTVLNASGHLGYANSVALDRVNAADHLDVAGVLRDSNGVPTGEFHEDGLAVLFAHGLMNTHRTETALRDAALLARSAGVTTHTDMAMMPHGATFDTLCAMSARGELPVRVVYSPNMVELFRRWSVEEIQGRFRDLRDSGTPWCQLGPLKWIADGSIQGFTAALDWPGYCGGVDHARLLLTAATIEEQVLPFHEAGFQVALHANGDLAIDEVLGGIEALQRRSFQPDHRHRVEHCQTASAAQLQKMARLGIGANFFSNHLYYWGDVHRTQTMGPAKARRANAAATALRAGVVTSIHSDAPVTPVNPLFTMWCAVNRMTRSGHVLGPDEALTPLEALTAVTLGAAALLRRDHELGSLEVGKWADFTVLAEHPLEVPPERLKDIAVFATVIAGQVT